MSSPTEPIDSRRIRNAVLASLRPTHVAFVTQLTALDDRLRVIEEHLRRPLPEPDPVWQALAAERVDELDPDKEPTE